MTSTTYRGHEIEDDDGHVTVWDGPDGDGWTEPTMAAAKATIDLFTPVTIFGITEAK
jgi:hypothetical protein